MNTKHKNYYDVLTWDIDKQKFTPQRGVRRGPYTLFGLRKALRKLGNMGYAGSHREPCVSVEVRQ